MPKALPTLQFFGSLNFGKIMGNNKKLTTKEFVERACKIHGNMYDYSKVIYKNMSHKVCIICTEHGEFYQTPLSHIFNRSGCPICGLKKAHSKLAISKNEFIKKARLVHGDKYDYSKANYINSHTKIDIFCKVCGSYFFQTPYSHLQGSGCPHCSNSIRAAKKTMSQERFIELANIKHNGKFTYDKVNYIKSNIKVCVTCPVHGDFMVTPNSHLSGYGCPMCSELRRGKSRVRPYQEFINISNIVHNNKYDYSLVTNNNYIDTKHKVPIICPQHGVFYQTPKSHKNGSGCPHCPKTTVSKGEDRVREQLDKIGIDYIPQYKIPNEDLFCKNKELYVDFYIPSKNMFIEYNGEQHYNVTGYFGGEQKLKDTQARDMALRHYCKEHKIKLIEIPYWDFDNIEEILKRLVINKVKTNT